VLALARGQVLTVLPLVPDKRTATEQQQQGSDQQQQQPEPQCFLHSSKHEYTALGWFSQLQSRRSAAGQQRQRQQQQQQQQTQQQQQQQGVPRCTPEVYQSQLECEVLLSGTADGHLQIHNAQGQLMYKQRLYGTAVMDIMVRPHCSGRWVVVELSV
jgi:isochorismate synthase EntC